MNTQVAKEIQSLSSMNVRELHQKYLEVFGEMSRSRNRAFLHRRIAWRIQANAFGDLPSRARKRAEELANDADIRLRAPSESITKQIGRPQIQSMDQRSNCDRDPRLPQPGTILTKTHKGKEIAVKVLDDGFEFDGQYYKTLSAIAKKVTGKQWNGFAFFGLAKKSR